MTSLYRLKKEARHGISLTGGCVAQPGPGDTLFLWAALSIRHYLVGFCSWWDESHANKKLWWLCMTLGGLEN